MKQKTTWKEYFAGKADDQLIAEAKGLHWAIGVEGCFGTHDLLQYDALISELDRRGYDKIGTIDFKEREKLESNITDGGRQ